jgi:hypothetical protein
MRGKGGRRRKQLLNKFKETIGCWKLKKKALNHPLCRTVSERVYRPAVRQDMK